MTFLVQLMTAAFFACFIVSGLNSNGPLHNSGIAIALALAAVAVIRQIVIITLCLFEQQKYRRTSALHSLEPSYTPSVSIIVPAFNESKTIKRALQSMLKLDYSNFEIIVIDDGSTDDTYSRACSLIPESKGKLRVYQQDNEGKSQALNLGIRISRKTLVLCVDADSTLKPNGLNKAVHYFLDPEVAAVAGVVEVELQSGTLITRLQRTEYLMSQRLTRAAIGFFSCIPIVPGPCGLFRRRDVINLGGYTSETTCFAEDAELSIRLLAENKKIVAEPQLISLTQPPADIYSLLRQRYRWNRGLVQALFLNAKALIFGKSSKGPALFFYLVAETLLLPLLCFGVALFFLASTIMSTAITSFTTGLIILVGLDILGLFLVLEKKRDFPTHVFEYILIRFFYAYVLTAWALLSINDELKAVDMSWDKLDRYGAIE